METIPRLPPQSLYIVKPVEGLSTTEVFKSLDMSECSEKNPRELLRKMEKGVIFADFVNDLEIPSFRLMPKLKELKEDLYKAGFNTICRYVVFRTAGIDSKEIVGEMSRALYTQLLDEIVNGAAKLIRHLRLSEIGASGQHPM
ncbi:GHMP kinase [Gracilaria domingensis]|nr:GHMP kinase [Gracilaria domingensis]